MLGNVGGTALWRGIAVPFYLRPLSPYFLFFFFRDGGAEDTGTDTGK